LPWISLPVKILISRHLASRPCASPPLVRPLGLFRLCGPVRIYVLRDHRPHLCAICGSLPPLTGPRSPRSAPFSRGLAVTARIEVSIGRWHGPCVVAHVFEVGPESVVLHAIACGHLVGHLRQLVSVDSRSTIALPVARMIPRVVKASPAHHSTRNSGSPTGLPAASEIRTPAYIVRVLHQSGVRWRPPADCVVEANRI
jgi:hypothetical protein